MGDKAYHSNLRVEGFVVPGSIEQSGTHVSFVMNEFESHSPRPPRGAVLTVNYKGSEPPPDNFKYDAQALPKALNGRDGVFHARSAGQVRPAVRHRANRAPRPRNLPPRIRPRAIPPAAN